MVKFDRSKREFIRRLGSGAASIALGSLASHGCGARQPRPNVLFIAIDDLNDWVGCLGGHPDAKTPNLDSLANRGILFRNAHCAAPLCNASRAALMTGIRPSTSGVYYNPQPFRDNPLLADAVTIPQHFMAHGYDVSGGGKIFHGRATDAESWHAYWPSKTQSRPLDPRPSDNLLPLNGMPGYGFFDWGPIDVDKSEMGDWKVTSWAIDQLEHNHNKPFFLGCGLFRPHLPWYVPREYFDIYPLDKLTLPNVNKNDLDDIPLIGQRIAAPGDHYNVVKHKQWHKAVQGYLASISFMDECLGRVIHALDNSPHRDNTVIVLWADHGWHLGEKLHWRKYALWEEATRNILLIVAPGITTPGSLCDAPVNLLDIYPTLIDLCRLDNNSSLEGTSLSPFFVNPALEREQPSLTTYGLNNHSLRSKHFRYIRYADGSEELYDHRTDPLEWNNIAGNTVYLDTKKALAEWLPKINAPILPPCPTDKTCGLAHGGFHM